MRNILLVAGVAGLVGVFSACGGDKHPHVVDDGTQTGGGTRNTGGSHSTAGKPSMPSDGGAGGAGAEVAVDPLAPTVTITSPEAITDPNEDGVLTGAAVTVNCRVTQSGEPGAGKVNAASVKLSITDADGKVIEEKSGAPAKTEDDYSADFSLTAIAAGVVGFKCQAEDLDKHVGTAKLSTLLDKGPTITFVQPETKSAHALSAPIDVEFTVNASPLTADDQNATVDAVTLDIAGQAIALDSAMDNPGHYRLQVNLADPKLFKPAPNGNTPITISATNKRTPTSVKSVTTEDLLVDGAGPTIQITQPLDKGVVGGKVKLTFNATDLGAGVDPKTIVVALNKESHTYDAKSDLWTVKGDTYTFEFDSRQVSGSVAQMTLNVSASDKVGNISGAASELLYLDNFAPLIDLDPLAIRTTAGGADSDKCSASFDPVGDRAKNDLSAAAHGGTFRAIVADQTNVDAEDKGQVLHFAGTNPKSVRLYLQPASAAPLVVDTNKDGLCDDVAMVDSTDSLELTTVPKTGQPLFAIDDAVDPSSASLGCTTHAATPPQNLCLNQASDMWQVIQDEYNNTPVIYAASPTPGVECTGVSWEFGAKLSADGWVCFATRAVDNVGNVGVSRPIRICVDDPNRAGTPACANSSTDAPSCTDGCTPQARFSGGKVLFK